MFCWGSSCCFFCFKSIDFRKNGLEQREHVVEVLCFNEEIPDGFEFFPASCVEKMFDHVFDRIMF